MNFASSIRQLCNIFHGATGRPLDHIPRTRTSLGSEGHYTHEMFGKHFGKFYTSTHTYNYLGGPKTGIMLHIFKLHQETVKTKAKIDLFTLKLTKYFSVKFLYIAITLSLFCVAHVVL